MTVNEVRESDFDLKLHCENYNLVLRDILFRIVKSGKISNYSTWTFKMISLDHYNSTNKNYIKFI